MNNEFSKIEDQLNKVSVQNLSSEEKQTLWVSIAREHATRPAVSPYSWMLVVPRRLMVTVSALLIFVLAGGSTVALADGAKPGDTLFALDRVTENVVLALTSEKSRDTVRVAMVNERVDELEALISDESSRRLARAEVEGDVQAKESPDAPSMMAILAVDSATTTDNGSEQEPVDNALITADVVVEVEKKDKKRSDIEEALFLVSEISSELEKRGNTEGRDSVRRAMKRLTGKLDELPREDNDTFREPFERVFLEREDFNDDDDDSDSDDSEDGDNEDSDVWTNDDGVLSPPNPRPEDIFDGDKDDEDSTTSNDGGSVVGGSVQGTSTPVNVDVNLNGNIGNDDDKVDNN